MSQPSVNGLFQRYYFDRPDFTDGTTEFHAMCRAAFGAPKRILELGAGPSNPTTRFLASIAPVVGVDVSSEVHQNDTLSEAHVYDGRVLPISDGSFDACVSNYVLEHVEDPRQHFSEVARVLRPNGAYVFRTPNLFHYVALVSRALPHVAHVVLSKRLRRLTDEDHDPWPTFYRANTARTVRQLARDAGLNEMEIRMVEKEPSYARGAKFAFYPLMAYERFVNASPSRAGLRANIFGVLRKAARSA